MTWLRRTSDAVAKAVFGGGRFQDSNPAVIFVDHAAHGPALSTSPGTLAAPCG